MKKILLLMFVFAIFSCKKSENTSSEVMFPISEKALTLGDANFNPDEADGMNFSDMRSQFGKVPKPAGKIQIGGVSKSFDNEYWRTLKEGMETGAKKLENRDYEISVNVRSAQGEGDEQGQLAVVQDMINKKYSALLLSPISDGNLVPGLEQALKSCIPVINVNDGMIAQTPFFVGPRAVQNGELAAEWISKQIGGNGEVAIVVGMPKAFAARQRTIGFEDWMAKNAGDIKIVAKQNADWDRLKAKDLADIWIKKYPNLKAIFCNNDTMALGVLEAVKASGRNIFVVGVDGIGEAYESIRQGGMSATVDSFPLYKGQIAVEVAIRVLGGQDIPRVIWTPQALIDKTNVDKKAEEIIGWTEAQFE